MPIFRSNIKSIILLVVLCLSTFLVLGNSYAKDCHRLIKEKEAKEKEVARLEAENESMVDTIIDIVETVVGYAEPVRVFFWGSAKDLEEVKDVIEEVNGDLDTAGGLIGKFKKDSEGLLVAVKKSQAALKKVVNRTEQARKIADKTAKRLEKAIENTKKVLHWVAEIRLLMKESDAARLSHGKELVATLCGVLEEAEVGSKAIVPLAYATQACKGLTGILEDLVFINATMLKRNQQLRDAGVEFDLYPHAFSDKPEEDSEKAARVEKIRELNQEIKDLKEDITRDCDPLTRAYEVVRTYCNKQVGDPNKLSAEHTLAQVRADKAREKFDKIWGDLPSTEEIENKIRELESDKKSNQELIKTLQRRATNPRLSNRQRITIANQQRELKEKNDFIDTRLPDLRKKLKKAPHRDSVAKDLAELERKACIKNVEYHNTKCKWNECMKKKLRFEATNGVCWANKSLTKKQIAAHIKATYETLYEECKEMDPADCEGKMVKVSAPTMVIPADGGPAYNVSVDTGEVPESQDQYPGVQVPPGKSASPGTQTPASATFTPGQAQPTQPGSLTPPSGPSQAQPSVGVSRDKCEPELPKEYQKCASEVSKSKQELRTLQQTLRQAKADLKTNKDELRKVQSQIDSLKVNLQFDTSLKDELRKLEYETRPQISAKITALEKELPGLEKIVETKWQNLLAQAKKCHPYVRIPLLKQRREYIDTAIEELKIELAQVRVSGGGIYGDWSDGQLARMRKVNDKIHKLEQELKGIAPKLKASREKARKFALAGNDPCPKIGVLWEELADIMERIAPLEEEDKAAQAAYDYAEAGLRLAQAEAAPGGVTTREAQAEVRRWAQARADAVLRIKEIRDKLYPLRESKKELEQDITLLGPQCPDCDTYLFDKPKPKPDEEPKPDQAEEECPPLEEDGKLIYFHSLEISNSTKDKITVTLTGEELYQIQHIGPGMVSILRFKPIEYIFVTIKGRPSQKMGSPFPPGDRGGSRYIEKRGSSYGYARRPEDKDKKQTYSSLEDPAQKPKLCPKTGKPLTPDDGGLTPYGGDPEPLPPGEGFITRGFTIRLELCVSKVEKDKKIFVTEDITILPEIGPLKGE
jgi:DNA repair exonuclease SbcCD ATPase subunit